MNWHWAWHRDILMPLLPFCTRMALPKFSPRFLAHSSFSGVVVRHDFVLAGRDGDSMCRGFPGGAWSLPFYVTHRR
jgi:hypothetical protein